MLMLRFPQKKKIVQNFRFKFPHYLP